MNCAFGDFSKRLQEIQGAWRADGACIVSLSPGIMQTPMGQQEFEQQPMMAMMVEHTPLKRIGQPEEIASAAEFLVSKNASFIYYWL